MKRLVALLWVYLLSACAHEPAHRDCARTLVPINTPATQDERAGSAPRASRLRFTEE